jgi:L-lactate utilization protein LutC
MSDAVRGNRKLLDDVANAVRPRDEREAPSWDESNVRIPIGDSLIDRFEREAIEVGMHVSRVDSVAVSDHLAELIQHVTNGVAGTVLLEPALSSRRERLRELRGVIDEPTEDDLFSALIGIVSAEAGIAETGSLARRAGPDQPRSFALTPMTLIVVLDASRIVADLLDWIGTIGGDEMPSECVLITGPSKSSDIGMQLVTGVHGPGVVHVVIVTDA